MEFITSEDMNKFRELGYTLKEEFKPNKLGTTYEIVVTDKDGKEVARSSSAYANLSGRGYSMSGVQHSIAEKLNDIINGDVTVETKEEVDWDFLNTLANWDYVSDYGLDKDGDLIILFDSWEQLEGMTDRETDEIKFKSVFAKLVDLAKEGKLKPSIASTLLNCETAFTDEYLKCDHCERIISREWEGLNYIESTCEMLCNDCVNESEEAIADLIEEAKDDFKKALPVMISEDKLINMGYAQLDEDKDFSTRYVWGEEDWNCHNIHADKCEEWCKQFGGFAKLVGVWQFDSQFQLYFPTDRIEEVRQFTGIGYKICL